MGHDQRETQVRAELEKALPRAYVAAFRWLGNREESRDACQEAAARVLRSAGGYDPAQPFYPWFYRILKNHCLDRLKGRRRNTEALSELRHTAEGRVGPNVEGGAMARERAQALGAALERLPEDLREVIELRHFQDLSYEELARVLECPTGTVMSRLYRARKALRELLREQGDFYDAKDAGCSAGSRRRS
jgi:RNA polymerase sigma-70 factor (ECF subfamily)